MQWPHTRAHATPHATGTYNECLTCNPLRRAKATGPRTACCPWPLVRPPPSSLACAPHTRTRAPARTHARTHTYTPSRKERLPRHSKVVRQEDTGAQAGRQTDRQTDRQSGDRQRVDVATPAGEGWRDHWRQNVCVLDTPMTVTKGDTVMVRACHDDWRIWFQVCKTAFRAPTNSPSADAQTAVPPPPTPDAPSEMGLQRVLYGGHTLRLVADAQVTSCGWVGVGGWVGGWVFTFVIGWVCMCV